MEEAIKSTAKWADRYIAFNNYDLQILDVRIKSVCNHKVIRKEY